MLHLSHKVAWNALAEQTRIAFDDRLRCKFKIDPKKVRFFFRSFARTAQEFIESRMKSKDVKESASVEPKGLEEKGNPVPYEILAVMQDDIRMFFAFGRCKASYYVWRLGDDRIRTLRLGCLYAWIYCNLYLLKDSGKIGFLRRWAIVYCNQFLEGRKAFPELELEGPLLGETANKISKRAFNMLIDIGVYTNLLEGKGAGIRRLSEECDFLMKDLFKLRGIEYGETREWLET